MRDTHKMTERRSIESLNFIGHWSSPVSKCSVKFPGAVIVSRGTLWGGGGLLVFDRVQEL